MAYDAHEDREVFIVTPADIAAAARWLNPAPCCSSCGTPANDMVAHATWPYAADVEQCSKCWAVTSFKRPVGAVELDGLGTAQVFDRIRIVKGRAA